MDFTTEGQRGLGRTTTFTPRLAGWKRKDIQRLSNNQKEQLYLFISQLVCAGYGVFLPFLRDQRDVQHVPVEELYRDWITSIYVTGEAVLPPDVRGHIANARPHFVSVFKHQYESILGLKVGMLSKAKFETIASYYFIAGICLASSEQSIAANLMADAL